MYDRFDELREMVYRRDPGAASQMREGQSAVLEVPTRKTGEQTFDIEAGLKKGEEQEEFMAGFFRKLDDLKEGIDDVKALLSQIRTLKHDAVRATTVEQEKQTSDKLNRIIDKSNGDIFRLKESLEEMKAENNQFLAKNPNSSQARIKINMHSAIQRKFTELLKEYHVAQTDYKNDVREKISRQIRIVFPEYSEEEVNELASEGDAMIAGRMMRQRLTGEVHESLTVAAACIEEKNKDIKRLEKSLVETRQMFQDFAVLIEAQAELLEQIEFNVNAAKDYTEKAEKELVQTRKNQKKAQKRTCWISVCVVVLAVIIVVPIMVYLT